MQEKTKVPFYKKTWFIILALIVFFPVGLILMWMHTDWGKIVKIVITAITLFIGIPALFSGQSDDDEVAKSEDVSEEMAQEESTEEESIEEESTEEATVEEEPTEEATVEEESTEEATVEESAKEDDVPTEWTSALRSAENYADIMSMSKSGIYDQLISEHGDNFPQDAAQYAIDNIEHDWNTNALESAKNYQEIMNMSHAAIYDQLISDHGDKFTPEQAQYAIDNLE